MRHISVLAVAALFAATLASPASADTGHASVTLVDPVGTPIGWARLVEDANGRLHVNVHAWGLSPGLHGIHLHAVGSCVLGTTPAFSSAGGHHNPLGAQHGLDNLAGAHAGDLPNLVVNEHGVGRLATTSDRASLTTGQVALLDANGSSLVIHAGPDDQQTDPTGNSGSRVACGVIEAR